MSHIDEALRRAAAEGRTDLPVPIQLNSPAADRGWAVPPGAPPFLPGDDETLDVRRMLRGLYRRRWQVLLVAGLVVVPVAVATVLTEPRYRAAAMVQIDPEPVQVFPYREITVPNLASNYEMFMKSEEQILRGRELVDRLASRLRSEAGPEGSALRSEADRLSAGLWLQRIENTQMFRLGYVAPRPDVTATVANLYAEEYLKLHFDTRQQTREKAKQQLEAELRMLEESVRQSDRELVAYAQAHGISTADNARSLIEEKLAALSTQLTGAEAEVFAAQSRLDSLGGASVAKFPEKLVSPVIAALVQRVTTLEHEKTALRATFGPNWGSVVQKDHEMALVRDQLVREKTAALEGARQQALLDLREAENKRRWLAAAAAEQQDLANRLENASIQFNIIKGETEKNRKLYEGVLEQLKKTSLSAGMEFGGFHVVEKAMPPGSVDSPKALWNLSLASLLGLALGVCIALGRDYWDNSISTIEEVEQLEQLPVLGTLALTNPDPARGLWGRLRLARPGAAGRDVALLGNGSGADSDAGVTELAGSAAAMEDVRTICASLLLARSDRPPRTLLVTSAGPGEGKTTVASAIARTLAESGAPTLLVDCDMRRGSVSHAFGTGDQGGLSLFLAGHLGSAPTVHGTRHEALKVVSAGPAPPNPPALLSSERMSTFLSETASAYRFVVLDAPPVMALADARILARMVEGVLLVIRAGKVPKSLVSRARHVLESSGATVLGAVLNGVAEDEAEAPYRYYRHYYRT